MIPRKFETIEQLKRFSDRIKLNKNEYLVHIRQKESYNNIEKINEKTVFYSKFNKNGKFPKKWLDWRKNDFENENFSIKYETFIWKETFRTGFQIISERIGKSQSWIILKTPEGWTFEISLYNFIKFVKNLTIKNGIIQEKVKIVIEDNNKSPILMKENN